MPIVAKMRFRRAEAKLPCDIRHIGTCDAEI